jgi:hypothetical protein
MVGKPIIISNEFDPKTFRVERFEYTSTGNAILVGRIYDYEEGKKRKDKNLEFLNYSIRLYGPDGKMIKDIKADVDGHYLVSSKVLQVKNELVLAAFYSNDKKKREINGLLVERLDPATGNVLVSTKQELNKGTISQVEDDEEDKGSKKRDHEDDEAGLAGNIVFRNFYMTPDNGLVILAEKYKREIKSSSSYTPGSPGFSGTTYNSTYVVYTCEDIYMAKISTAGEIDWLYDLPKSQAETIQIGGSTSPGFSPSSAGYYFDLEDNRPFYAGFGSISSKNMVHIFFNDRDANADVLQQGKKVKRIRSFGSSVCYEVDLDMLTGKFTRKNLYTNKDIPTSMPRLGVAMNDVLYITGKDDKFMAKSKVVVGKIVCQN